MSGFQPALPTKGFAKIKGAFCWRSRLRLTLFLPLVALGACSTTPSRTLDIAEPELAGFSTSAAQLPMAVRWWQEFHDPMLNELVATSLEANNGLQAEWATVSQYRALARQAGAERYPEINAGLERQQLRSDGQLSSDQWSATLSTSYELDFWGRVAALDKQAVLQADSRERVARVEANTVAAQVSLAWYGLIASSRQQQLLQQQKQRTEQLLESTRGRYQRGQAAVTDIWQQQQLLAALQSELDVAAGQQRLYWQQLALWTGRGEWLLPGDATARFQKELPGRHLPNNELAADEIALSALQQRPDVEQAWLDLQAADAGVAAAVANRYPRFTLSATVGTESPSVSGLFDSWFSSLTAGLVMPVLDAGNRKAAVDAQQAAAQAALYRYQQVLLEAATEVQEALVNTDTARRQLQGIDEQLALATRTEDYQTSGYHKGVVTYPQLLDAQKSRLELENQQLSARWQLVQYRIQLYRALSHADFPANVSDDQVSDSKVSE
ncbi:TolC family protein [Parathalassolituus penaei]|uniref:TolC family protein n=1 Tax=Parathalassolituus penaei TaxID=2997323 RepID=A0A9X3EGA1_9GAMM|nr:TolC family protein [Parathalassolituus penaei]MCY0966675.1 TolC family protein [Parathalassolituus penaei]